MADRVKAAFAGTVKAMLQRAVEIDGLPTVEEEYSDEVSFEYQDISPLNCRVRINQGPYKGPRYFDVIVKEHI
jgi:hypothetical protein